MKVTREHLREVYKCDRECDLSRLAMEAERKAYTRFYELLGLKFIDKEADRIFQSIYLDVTPPVITSDAPTTLNKVVAKTFKDGKTPKEGHKSIKKDDRQLQLELDGIEKLQEEYHKNNVLPKIIECEGENSHYTYLGRQFLNNFDKKVQKMLRLFYKDFDALLFTQSNTGINIVATSFETLVEEAKSLYQEVNEYTEKMFKSMNQKYINPYLNLYIFCRNRRLLDTIIFERPQFHLFDKLKNFDLPVIEKEFYCLEDVAINYLTLKNKPGKLADNAVKNCERNVEGCFKNGMMPFLLSKNKELTYNQLIEAIAYYVYYTQNNKKESFGDLKITEDSLYQAIVNPIISFRMAPILQLKISKKDKVLTMLEDLYKYIEDEYNRILHSTTNNDYQFRMLEFLFYLPKAIGQRCLDIKHKDVYSHFIATLNTSASAFHSTHYSLNLNALFPEFQTTDA